MKWLIIVVLVVSAGLLAGIFSLLCQNLRYAKRYQAQAEKIFQEYTAEAEVLDDMAGLLEGLFEIENPKQRHICVKCIHLKRCIYENRLPETDGQCDDFDAKKIQLELENAADCVIS